MRGTGRRETKSGKNIAALTSCPRAPTRGPRAKFALWNAGPPGQARGNKIFGIALLRGNLGGDFLIDKRHDLQPFFDLGGIVKQGFELGTGFFLGLSKICR